MAVIAAASSLGKPLDCATSTERTEPSAVTTMDRTTEPFSPARRDSAGYLAGLHVSLLGAGVRAVPASALPATLVKSATADASTKRLCTTGDRPLPSRAIGIVCPGSAHGGVDSSASDRRRMLSGARVSTVFSRQRSANVTALWRSFKVPRLWEKRMLAIQRFSARDTRRQPPAPCHSRMTRDPSKPRPRHWRFPRRCRRDRPARCSPPCRGTPAPASRL